MYNMRQIMRIILYGYSLFLRTIIIVIISYNSVAIRGVVTSRNNQKLYGNNRNFKLFY